MYIHAIILTALKKLDETNLPPKEAFCSKLTGEGITDEDYEHAHTVWKEFNIESMKDYYKLYNLSDVLLSADIFENFRSICMNQITKIQLELLSDPEMFLMIESGIRGGIATISHRHAKANNEYMELSSILLRNQNSSRI